MPWPVHSGEPKIFLVPNRDRSRIFSESHPNKVIEGGGKGGGQSLRNLILGVGVEKMGQISLPGCDVIKRWGGGGSQIPIPGGKA